ncbi:MAG: HAD family hydrolase [Caldilineaceae bacterium]|nr:HAD family hydrolase [Caldilineaceae bacterium]
MSVWLKKLVDQYDRMRLENAHDQKILLLDIDGTILDIRYAVYHLLRQYDRQHETDFFQNLNPAHIQSPLNSLPVLLKNRRIKRKDQRAVEEWVLEHLYTEVTIHQYCQLQEGIFDLIRWFQMQPNTRVALVTGRPETQRVATLLMLNTLGETYRVSFRTEWLFMRPTAWASSVAMYKVEAVQQLQGRGFQIMAMIDSEPENLAAIDAADEIKPFLLMHTDTLRFSDPLLLPRHASIGHEFNVHALITMRDLPRQVQLVWSGIRGRDDLLAYLMSDIEWVELNIYANPVNDHLLLNIPAARYAGAQPSTQDLNLDDTLNMLKMLDKSVKFKLNIEGRAIMRLLEAIARYQFPQHKICFDLLLDSVGPKGVQQITSAYPDAVLQTHIGPHLSIQRNPVELKSQLKMAESWGVSRFALSYCQQGFRQTFIELSNNGFDLCIDGINNRKKFIDAILLEPSSITGDFHAIMEN